MASHFDLSWYVLQDIPPGPSFKSDLAVPIIDGTPLYQLLPDSPWPGIRVEWVYPPSRHWLGEPQHFGYDRPVILDAECQEIECCAVVADIVYGDDLVSWSNFYSHGTDDIPAAVSFTFARWEYDRAILSLPSAPRVDWTYQL